MSYKIYNSTNWKEAELHHLDFLWDIRPKEIKQHTKENWDGWAHDWEKELREDEKRRKRSQKRVEATARYLIKRGVLGPDCDVIDIGCGPGRFVAEFAKTAKHAAGLDISDQMTEYGLAYCKEMGLDNVSFFAKDFKEMDVEKEGMTEKYDLVFSSITPAIGCRGGYEKAMKMSKKWFFNANFISTSDTLQESLSEMMGIHPVRSRDGTGFYCMLNELILKGYYPELEYYRENDVVEYNVESAFLEYSKWFFRNGIMEKDEKRMKDALASLSDRDGKIRSEKEWVYVWLLVGKKGRFIHEMDTDQV